MSEMTKSEAQFSPPPWSDAKRYLWLLGAVVVLLPFVGLGIYLGTGSSFGWWFTPFAVVFLIPLLDFIFGRDSSNPPDEVVAWLEEDKYYRFLVMAYIPLQFLNLAMAVYFWTRPELSVLDKVGLAISMGYVTGVAINTAHELGHKKEEVERWLSKVALAPSWYGHFFVEHNRGHHVRVATPEDPATGRMGENVYGFFLRSAYGSLKSAWKLESVRMRRRKLSVFNIRNNNLNAWLMSAALYAVIFAIAGWAIWPYLIIQAVFGFFLLESINFLEHYGLLRQKMADGRYERVRAQHSWNSDNLTSNVLLFHLQRHSDHHANPTRRYQALRSYRDAPELPLGYAPMIVVAWIPPLWRRVMDRRLLAHYDGRLDLINVKPGKREQIARRYADAVVPAAESEKLAA